MVNEMTNTTNQEIIENQSAVKQEIELALKPEIVVVNQETYVAANDHISRLQTLKKEVQKRFAEPKKKASEAHKAICELEKTFLAPIENKIRLLKDSTTNWYAAEQQRIAAEEERRKAEAEKLAALAVEAENSGEADIAAEAVAAAAMENAIVTVMPKVKGTSMREVWKAVIVDINAIPREYLVVNQAALDKVAQATRGAIVIPGVKMVKTYINSTKAK